MTKTTETRLFTSIRNIGDLVAGEVVFARIGRGMSPVAFIERDATNFCVVETSKNKRLRRQTVYQVAEPAPEPAPEPRPCAGAVASCSGFDPKPEPVAVAADSAQAAFGLAPKAPKPKATKAPRINVQVRQGFALAEVTGRWPEGLNEARKDSEHVEYVNAKARRKAGQKAARRGCFIGRAKPVLELLREHYRGTGAVLTVLDPGASAPVAPEVL